MKLIKHQSKCVNQWTLYFKNGWIIQSTFQNQDVSQCVCKRSCHLLPILPTVPGVLLSIVPYKNMTTGVYTYPHDLYTHSPCLMFFELRDSLKIAWTIGICGPRLSREKATGFLKKMAWCEPLTQYKY